MAEAIYIFGKGGRIETVGKTQDYAGSCGWDSLFLGGFWTCLADQYDLAVMGGRREIL